MSFLYKNVLILGATSGIGKNLAETILKRSSAKVVVTGRREERLKEFVNQHGGRSAYYAFDMAKLDGIEGNFNKIFSEHPDIDFVIHVAGIQRVALFHKPEELDIDMLAHEVNLNYTSVLYTLKYALPHLLSHGGGSTKKNAAIGVVSSGLAITPFTISGNYAATKAAVHHLVYAIREQLNNTNVNVIEIIPPLVNTELGDDAMSIGVPINKLPTLPMEEFSDLVWKGLESGETQIAPGTAGDRVNAVEAVREPLFRRLDDFLKNADWWYKDRA
ncbi:hypothetical protein CI109_103893 [Kwoniella shandongensis]|uniref:Uncharacterized protein n=1 Tax=Kwoniella shandongensis TaxID=1734106 RepID=A0A5M6BTC3_9TREE|nr:uncharacterized protein CI109_005653 [Kwoniella shandongensis]KAA5526057.1 hypothetical protein CI109_005653 [Kwoniella shandongensis]